MIYFVEDDTSIRELVLYTLNSSGLQAAGFDKPSAFWKAVDSSVPSLVVLDLMLPEEDGLHILKKLRSMPATSKLPIMLLTAKNSEYDKVIGLDGGADDYMTKPFGMMELLSRIKALLRRTSTGKESDQVDIGSLHVSVLKHEVTVDDVKIELTLKEFELLVFLLEHKGMVMTRDQLLNQIWGYAFDGESRTVDVHIRSLRQKLGICGDYIETVRGVGYKIGGSKT